MEFNFIQRNYEPGPGWIEAVGLEEAIGIVVFSTVQETTPGRAGGTPWQDATSGPKKRAGPPRNRRSPGAGGRPGSFRSLLTAAARIGNSKVGFGV